MTFFGRLLVSLGITVVYIGCLESFGEGGESFTSYRYF